MPFTEVFDPAFPPDTQAANQLGLDIRNFKTDIAQRLAAMTGSIGTPPSFENVFAGVPFFNTTTGKVYQFTGSGFTEITPLILSNISEVNATLQAAIVAAIAGIPASAPGPLVLPTGAEVLTSPTAGDNSTQVATTAFVQENTTNSTPIISGNAIKIPLTFSSLGVPLTFVTIQGGTVAAPTGNSYGSATVTFSPAYTTVIAAVSSPNNELDSGARPYVSTVESLSNSGFTMGFSGSDTGFNLTSGDAAWWIAIGISN